MQAGLEGIFLPALSLLFLSPSTVEENQSCGRRIELPPVVLGEATILNWHSNFTIGLPREAFSGSCFHKKDQ